MSLYNEYLVSFNEQLGIPIDDIKRLGKDGKILTQAEYKMLGMPYYSTSIIVPMRNAYYMNEVLPKRLAHLRANHKIETPLLDFGCGVGFTLVALAKLGYTGLYGHEIQGVQKDLTTPIFEKYNISWFNPISHPQLRFKTTFCFNVLEHLANPKEVLNYLRSISDKVIANCGVEEDGDHPTSVALRQEIVEDLKKNGEHY